MPESLLSRLRSDEDVMEQLLKLKTSIYYKYTKFIREFQISTYKFIADISYSPPLCNIKIGAGVGSGALFKTVHAILFFSQTRTPFFKLTMCHKFFYPIFRLKK